MRWISVVTILFLSVMAVPLRARAQGDPGSETIALVNQFRAANGLAGLTVDSSLMSAAQAQANFMVRTRQFGHAGEGGSTPQDRALAAGYRGIAYENYVHGTNMTPTQAVEWWKNSGIHRATMLLSQGQNVGIGYAYDGGSPLYVLVVGYTTQIALEPPGEDDQPDDPGQIVVPIEISQPREDGSVWHVVQQGQTAWAIAATYGVSLDEMLAINSLTRPVTLTPGQEIVVKLGPGQSPPPTPTPPATHVVQDGESLWDVAVRYNLTVDDLLSFNGLTRADVIKPGDELRLQPGGAIYNEASPIVLPLPGAVEDQQPPAVAAAPTDSEPADTALTDEPTETPTREFVPQTPTPLPTLTPTSAAAPSATPTEGPVTLVPTATATPQAVVLVAPTPVPPAAAAPSTKDNSGPDRVVVIGVGALAVVWLAVLGFGTVSVITGRKKG